MRAALLLSLLASAVALSLAAPLAANICSQSQVALELRPTPQGRLNNLYQLALVAVDPHVQAGKADFVDIHYRINNEDSVNLRVLSEAALTTSNDRAKQAQVDGIQLSAGDVLRAYATYSTQGIACDSPIHTFSAPESDVQPQFRAARNNNMNNNVQQMQMQQAARTRVMQRNADDAAEDRFWTAAAEEAEANHAAGACPAIAMDQDIMQMAGLSNTYVLSFENKTPGKQLHYVDLHISTNPSAEGYDNLRLATNMELTNAHKVMQPGVVIRPNEQLSWFWSYRTQSTDGVVVDCTTPVTTIAPQQVQHSVDLNQLNRQ